MPQSLFLAPLQEVATVWRADELARPIGAVLATGHPALDRELPGGGWPVGAASEILQAQSGQNEWRLLLPALARAAGPVVLVGAPHVPFGPGLAGQGLAPDQLLWITAQTPGARMWAGEQALRCAQVAAVLVWLPQVRADQMRRLQMAAAEHAKLLFVLRPAQARAEPSPAALRLLLADAANGTDLLLQIIKRRGPPLQQALAFPARAARLAALLALRGASHALDRVAAAA